MRSAWRAAAMRWCTISTVMPSCRQRRSSDSTSSDSDTASSAAVGSSSSSSLGRRNSALATATRAAWPPLMPPPSRLTRCAYPPSSVSMKVSAPAAAAAARTSSSVASGRPKRMLSATVPRVSAAPCCTQPIEARNSVGSLARTSTPDTHTVPSEGSTNRATRSSSVLLPPPLGPTSDTTSPRSTDSVTPRSTALARAADFGDMGSSSPSSPTKPSAPARGPYAKCTPSNSTAGARLSTQSGCLESSSASSNSAGASSSASTRLLAPSAA